MEDFNTLKQRFMLKTEGNSVYVKPLDRRSFETFPLDDMAGVILISKDDYLGLLGRTKRFNETLTGVEEI